MIQYFPRWQIKGISITPKTGGNGPMFCVKISTQGPQHCLGLKGYWVCKHLQGLEAKVGKTLANNLSNLVKVLS